MDLYIERGDGDWIFTLRGEMGDWIFTLRGEMGIGSLDWEGRWGLDLYIELGDGDWIFRLREEMGIGSLD